MKRKTKVFKKSSLLLLAAIIPGLIGSCAKAPETIADDSFNDPVSYEKERVVSVKEPDRRVTRDGESASLVIPDLVKLHYHNDDNACQNRRFYNWVTGVDGIERMPDHLSPTDIDITLDFNVHTEYANMPSLFLIIKVKGTWSGQSEDTEINYADYQDVITKVKVDDKDRLLLELWAIPGEGNSIEL